MNYREKWHRAVKERLRLERASHWLFAALIVSNLCWLAFTLDHFLR